MSHESFGRSSHGAFIESPHKMRDRADEIEPVIPGTVSRFDADLNLIWRWHLGSYAPRSTGLFKTHLHSCLFGTQARVWGDLVSVCHPSSSDSSASILRLSDGLSHTLPSSLSASGAVHDCLRDPDGSWRTLSLDRVRAYNSGGIRTWSNTEWRQHILSAAIGASGDVLFGAVFVGSHPIIRLSRDGISQQTGDAYPNYIPPFLSRRSKTSGVVYGVWGNHAAAYNATHRLWYLVLGVNCYSMLEPDVNGNAYVSFLTSTGMRICSIDTVGGVRWLSAVLGGVSPSVSGPMALAVHANRVVAMGKVYDGKNCWILDADTGGVIDARNMSIGSDCYSIEPDGSGGFVVGHELVT